MRCGTVGSNSPKIRSQRSCGSAAIKQAAQRRATCPAFALSTAELLLQIGLAHEKHGGAAVTACAGVAGALELGDELAHFLKRERLTGADRRVAGGADRNRIQPG